MRAKQSDPAEQFHSLRNRHMLNIAMPKSPARTKYSPASAAELALKVHALISDPEILADMTDGERMMQEIADTVDLTEVPEDAVCGLVIDLLQYCEQEKIDWNQDVMSRAWEHFRREHVHELQER